MESGSGGSENVHDSTYTEAKNVENSSAFNGSVSAVSFCTSVNLVSLTYEKL